MAEFLMPVNQIDVHQLSAVIRNRLENVLIIDSRSFIEHNACHIVSAVNVGCSKIVKRRLQQDKLSIQELLTHTCQCDVDDKLDVVVYDKCAKDPNSLPVDSFLVILLKKLQLSFRSVTLLSGGFEEFHRCFPELCEDKTKKCPSLTSLSQPCLPITNQGPTRILPFLYLGTQFDATNKELLKDHNITYALNVSISCPQPEFLLEGHFMRIPVNDTYNEKLLPYFPEAFNFIDKAREGNSCMLIHCLAGISRSPTVAIAYVMRYLRLSSDDGYRYVKSKRPTISPNFNFLGQLLEYEKQLISEQILDPKPEATSTPSVSCQKRFCRNDMRKSSLSLDISPQKNENIPFFPPSKSGDQSPTSALAKLSFDGQSSQSEEQKTLPDFRQFRSKSCYGDWLRTHEEILPDKKQKECIAALSKILSPVKEIKCDALISEISSGNFDRDGNKCKEMSRKNYNKRGDHLNSSRPNTASYNSDKCSQPTLSGMSSTSNSKICELFDTSQKSKKTKSNSPSFSEKYQWSLNERKELKRNSCFPQSYKRTCYTSLVRSSEDLPKSDPIRFQEYSALQYKKSFSHHSFSLNSDLHKLADSSDSSVFDCQNLMHKSQLLNRCSQGDSEDLANSNFGNLKRNYISLSLSEEKSWKEKMNISLGASDYRMLKGIKSDPVIGEKRRENCS